MRKIILFAILLTSLTAVSQTIVGTDVENKNVVLEEFTGIHCGYCPDGHAIAQAILDENPGDVFLVNVHVGGYANPGAGEPDFRTPFGSAIAGQSGLAGYPAGTVNRHYFTGTSQGTDGTTAQSRSTWASTSNEVLAEESYVNVAVEAEVDMATRQMTIHVEAYYTGDSPEATNLLNVAILQDNTLGPQSGGGAGDNYNHMHRLVNMVTGQWGQTLETTTSGTFVDETYTYTVPFLYNDVIAVLENLQVVAFITETHQEIVTGGGNDVVVTGTLLDNEIVLTSVADILDTCSTSVIPNISIFNNGNNELTSLNIEYSINSGATETYSWTGALATNESTDIDLSEISFELNETNTFNVSIQDDDNIDTNVNSTTFNSVTLQASHTLITVDLRTDSWGGETSWKIIDENDGSTILSGSGYGNNTIYSDSVLVDENMCYSLIVDDTYGDGIIGDGYFKVLSGDDIIIEAGADIGSQLIKGFITLELEGIATEELYFTEAIIFPNPANSQINVENAAGLNVVLFDVLGREVYRKNNISIEEQINVANLNAGTYMLKLSDNNVSRTEKIVIMK